MKKLTILLALSGILLTACQTNEVQNEQDLNTVAAVDTTTVATTPTDIAVESENTGNFSQYSEEKFNEYLGEKPVALFFHAKWCPLCLATEKELNANLSELPEGSTILLADYDTESDLKKTYGVTTQTTFVFIDAEGNVVNKLVNPNFDTIIENLNQTL